MQIRVATEGDVGALAALNQVVHDLHVQAMPGTYKPSNPEGFAEVFRARLAEPGQWVWLAEDARGALGYLVGILHVREGDMFQAARRVFEVDQLAVVAHARGEGVGRALMATAEATAAEEGCTRVALTVVAFNDYARGFYEALGYAPRSVRLSRALT